jgi:hypothetical protein
MLRFIITEDGASAPQVLGGSERGAQAYKVRAYAPGGDWESAALAIKTSAPTDNPPKYLAEAGADSLSEDGNYSFWSVRGHSVLVECASKIGTAPIIVEVYF